MTEENTSNESNLLLDSSLITGTIFDNNPLIYNTKVVLLDDYIQVYLFESKKKKNFDKKDKKSKCDIDNLETKKNNDNLDYTNSVESKNIIRSKLQCQRLAKCNSKEWKTFITLTIAKNITDIDIANKKLNCFTHKVKRVFKDFKYICIPEFQKRGAVHFHLLTNIDINNKDLIYTQENNKRYKHVKYWLDGYDKVDTLDGDIKKIIGYISKYMTKDIDNRLFNRRRYHYSNNLNKPIESFIDLSTEKGENYLKKIIQDRELIYHNNYSNSYDKSNVVFLEYLK